MAIVRVYGVRPTSDGSGSVIASVEALADNGAPLNLRTEVTLSAEQAQSLLGIYGAGGLPALQAALVAMAGEIDARFTLDAVRAWVTANGASAQVVAAISALGILPFDVTSAQEE